MRSRMPWIAVVLAIAIGGVAEGKDTKKKATATTKAPTPSSQRRTTRSL